MMELKTYNNHGANNDKMNNHSFPYQPTDVIYEYKYVSAVLMDSL